MSDNVFVKPMDVVKVKLEKFDNSVDPTLQTVERVSVIKEIKPSYVEIKLENSNYNDEATPSTSYSTSSSTSKPQPKKRRGGRKKKVVKKVVKKVKKEPTEQPEKKLLNPKSMVRYDSAVCNGYQSIWVCKNCLTTVLSENDVNPHITRCKKRMTFNIRGVTKNRVPVNCFRQTASPEPYICKCCSLVFRRKVTLDRHLINKKNKATTSDEEEDHRKTKRKYRKKKK